MPDSHTYTAQVTWTGNRGNGTRSYQAYDRNWEVTTPGKAPILCSNDPLLGGDPALHNPEDMLLSALSACHMLWYLHLASTQKIVVTAYTDAPVGEADVAPDGTGRFTSATLRPVITLAAGTDIAVADGIHDDIHARCFIAQSVRFPVGYEPTYEIAQTA